MNTGYVFTVEDFEAAIPALTPVWSQHYREMQDRLAGEGVNLPEFNPRLDAYVRANKAGYCLLYTVRLDGRAVGYSIDYLTNDMHNGELIAKEDTVYVLPEHRNGVGRQFVKFILADLKKRGARRAYITAVTDPRAVSLWKRLKFRVIGQVMTFSF